MSMQVIEHIEVGSGGAASITFSSIPQDFTDLYLVLSLRSNQTTSVAALGYQFNGATSGYSARDLYTYNSGTPASGTYTTAVSNSLTVGRMGDGQLNTDGSTASTFSNICWTIPNYTSSNPKSWSLDAVAESNGNPTELSINAGLWSGTVAISSITLTPLGNYSFVQYSSATLYGISNS